MPIIDPKDLDRPEAPEMNEGAEVKTILEGVLTTLNNTLTRLPSAQAKRAGDFVAIKEATLMRGQNRGAAATAKIMSAADPVQSTPIEGQTGSSNLNITFAANANVLDRLNDKVSSTKDGISSLQVQADKGIELKVIGTEEISRRIVDINRMLSSAIDESGKNLNIELSGVPAIRESIDSVISDLVSLRKMASKDLGVAFNIHGIESSMEDISKARRMLDQIGDQSISLDVMVSGAKESNDEVNKIKDSISQIEGKSVSIGVGGLDGVSRSINDAQDEINSLEGTIASLAVSGVDEIGENVVDAQRKIDSIVGSSVTIGVDVEGIEEARRAAKNLIKDFGEAYKFGLNLSDLKVVSEKIETARPKFAKGGFVPEKPGGVDVTVAEPGTGGELIIPMAKLNALAGKSKDNGGSYAKQLVNNIRNDRGMQSSLVEKSNSVELTDSEKRKLIESSVKTARETTILERLFQVGDASMEKISKTFDNKFSQMTKENEDASKSGMAVPHTQEMIGAESEKAALDVLKNIDSGITELIRESAEKMEGISTAAAPVKGTAHVSSQGVFPMHHTEVDKSIIDAIYKASHEKAEKDNKEGHRYAKAGGETPAHIPVAPGGVPVVVSESKPESIVGTQHLKNLEDKAGSNYDSAKNNGEVVEEARNAAFVKMADAQRGKPESLGAGVSNYTQFATGGYGDLLEHVGDLTHRLGQYGGHDGALDVMSYGFNEVEEKIRKAHGRLDPNAVSMWENNAKETAVEIGVDPNQAVLELREHGKKYADAHRQVPVFNEMQWNARQAAISLGEMDNDAYSKHINWMANYVSDDESKTKGGLFGSFRDRSEEAEQRRDTIMAKFVSKASEVSYDPTTKSLKEWDVPHFAEAKHGGKTIEDSISHRTLEELQGPAIPKNKQRTPFVGENGENDISKEAAEKLKEINTRYMSAVSAVPPNMEEAEKLVSEAAKISGYTTLAYNGVQKDPGPVYGDHENVRSEGGKFGFFFTPQEEVARKYTRDSDDGVVKKVFLNLGKNLDIPFDWTSYKDLNAFLNKEGIDLNEAATGKSDEEKKSQTESPIWLHFLKQSGMDPDLAREAMKKGKINSLTINDTSARLNAFTKGEEQVPAGQKYAGETYVVFNAEQVKSADVITRDESGEIIPLIDRFNPRKVSSHYDSAKQNGKVVSSVSRILDKSGSAAERANEEQRWIDVRKSNNKMWDELGLNDPRDDKLTRSIKRMEAYDRIFYGPINAVAEKSIPTEDPSISVKVDAEKALRKKNRAIAYRKAFDDQDEALSRKLLLEQADEEGYTTQAYNGLRGDDPGPVYEPRHGVRSEGGQMGNFFTPQEEVAKKYAETITPDSLVPGIVKQVRLNLGNTLDMPETHMSEKEFNSFLKDKGVDYQKNTSEYVLDDSKKIPTWQHFTRSFGGDPIALKKAFMDAGYDSLTTNDQSAVNLKNNNKIPEGQKYIGETYVVFDNKRIKSSEPWLYDDNGSLIGLDKRFDKDNRSSHYDSAKNDGKRVSAIVSEATTHIQGGEDVLPAKELADLKSGIMPDGGVNKVHIPITSKEGTRIDVPEGTAVIGSNPLRKLETEAVDVEHYARAKNKGKILRNKNRKLHANAARDLALKTYGDVVDGNPNTGWKNRTQVEEDVARLVDSGSVVSRKVTEAIQASAQVTPVVDTIVPDSTEHAFPPNPFDAAASLGIDIPQPPPPPPPPPVTLAGPGEKNRSEITIPQGKVDKLLIGARKAQQKFALPFVGAKDQVQTAGPTSYEKQLADKIEVMSTAQKDLFSKSEKGQLSNDEVAALKKNTIELQQHAALLEKLQGQGQDVRNAVSAAAERRGTDVEDAAGTSFTQEQIEKNQFDTAVKNYDLFIPGVEKEIEGIADKIDKAFDRSDIARGVSHVPAMLSKVGAGATYEEEYKNQLSKQKKQTALTTDAELKAESAGKEAEVAKKIEFSQNASEAAKDAAQLAYLKEMATSNSVEKAVDAASAEIVKERTAAGRDSDKEIAKAKEDAEKISRAIQAGAPKGFSEGIDILLKDNVSSVKHYEKQAETRDLTPAEVDSYGQHKALSSYYPAWQDIYKKADTETKKGMDKEFLIGYGEAIKKDPADTRKATVAGRTRAMEFADKNDPAAQHDKTADAIYAVAEAAAKSSEIATGEKRLKAAGTPMSLEKALDAEIKKLSKTKSVSGISQPDFIKASAGEAESLKKEELRGIADAKTQKEAQEAYKKELLSTKDVSKAIAEADKVLAKEIANYSNDVVAAKSDAGNIARATYGNPSRGVKESLVNVQSRELIKANAIENIPGTQEITKSEIDSYVDSQGLIAEMKSLEDSMRKVGPDIAKEANKQYLIAYGKSKGRGENDKQADDAGMAEAIKVLKTSPAFPVGSDPATLAQQAKDAARTAAATSAVATNDKYNKSQNLPKTYKEILNTEKASLKTDIDFLKELRRLGKIDAAGEAQLVKQTGELAGIDDQLNKIGLLKPAQVAAIDSATVTAAKTLHPGAAKAAGSGELEKEFNASASSATAYGDSNAAAIKSAADAMQEDLNDEKIKKSGAITDVTKIIGRDIAAKAADIRSFETLADKRKLDPTESGDFVQAAGEQSALMVQKKGFEGLDKSAQDTLKKVFSDKVKSEVLAGRSAGAENVAMVDFTTALHNMLPDLDNEMRASRIAGEDEAQRTDTAIGNRHLPALGIEKTYEDQLKKARDAEAAKAEKLNRLDKVSPLNAKQKATRDAAVKDAKSKDVEAKFLGEMSPAARLEIEKARAEAIESSRLAGGNTDEQAAAGQFVGREKFKEKFRDEKGIDIASAEAQINIADARIQAEAEALAKIISEMSLSMQKNLHRIGEAAKRAERLKPGATQEQIDAAGADAIKAEVLKDAGNRTKVDAAGTAGASKAENDIRTLGDLEAAIKRVVEPETDLTKKADESTKALGRQQAVAMTKGQVLRILSGEVNVLAEDEKRLTEEVKKLDAEAGAKASGTMKFLAENIAKADRSVVGLANSIGVGGSKVGVATAGYLALGSALGKLAEGAAAKMVEIAKFSVAMSTAGTHVNLTGSTRSIEEIRSKLQLTREQAKDMFGIIREGAYSGVTSVDKLTDAAEKLRQTFGAFDKEKLQAYLNLLKSMPELEDIQAGGNEKEKGTARFGIALSGKTADYLELRQAGLFGGKQTTMDGSKTLNTQQAMQHNLQRIEEKIYKSLPDAVVALGEISKGVHSTAATAKQILGALALFGAIQVRGMVSGASGIIPGFPGGAKPPVPGGAGGAGGFFGKLPKGAGVAGGVTLVAGLAALGLDITSSHYQEKASEKLATGNASDEEIESDLKKSKGYGIAGAGVGIAAGGAAALIGGGLAASATGAGLVVGIPMLLAGLWGLMASTESLTKNLSKSTNANDYVDESKLTAEQRIERKIRNEPDKFNKEVLRGARDEDIAQANVSKISAGIEARFNTELLKVPKMQAERGRLGFDVLKGMGGTVNDFNEAIAFTSKAITTKFDLLAKSSEILRAEILRTAKNEEDRTNLMMQLKDRELQAIMDFVNEIEGIQKRMIESAPNTGLGRSQARLASAQQFAAGTPSVMNQLTIKEMIRSSTSAIPTSETLAQSDTTGIAGVIDASKLSREQLDVLKHLDKQGGNALDRAGYKKENGKIVKVNEALLKKVGSTATQSAILSKTFTHEYGVGEAVMDKKTGKQAIDRSGRLSFTGGYESKQFISRKDLEEISKTQGTSFNMASIGDAPEMTAEYFTKNEITDRNQRLSDVSKEIEKKDKEIALAKDSIKPGDQKKLGDLQSMQRMLSSLKKSSPDENFLSAGWRAAKSSFYVPFAGNVDEGRAEEASSVSTRETLMEQVKSSKSIDPEKKKKALKAIEDNLWSSKDLQDAFDTSEFADALKAQKEKLAKLISEKDTLEKLKSALQSGGSISDIVANKLNDLKAATAETFAAELEKSASQIAASIEAPRPEEILARTKAKTAFAGVLKTGIGGSANDSQKAVGDYVESSIEQNRALGGQAGLRAESYKETAAGLEKAAADMAAEGRIKEAAGLRGKANEFRERAADAMVAQRKYYQDSLDSMKVMSDAMEKLNESQPMKYSRSVMNLANNLSALTQYAPDMAGTAKESADAMRKSSEIEYQNKVAAAKQTEVDMKAALEKAIKEGNLKPENGETVDQLRARKTAEIEATKKGTIAGSEVELQRGREAAAKREYDTAMMTIEARKSLFDTEIDFFTQIGASYGSILQLQGQSLELVRQEIDAKKKSMIEQGLTGDARKLQEMEIAKMEIGYQKQVMGMQRNAFDNLLGTAIGGLRDVVGSSKNRMGAAGIMGLAATRFKTTFGTFGKETSGVDTRTENRAGRMGMSPGGMYTPKGYDGQIMNDTLLRNPLAGQMGAGSTSGNLFQGIGLGAPAGSRMSGAAAWNPNVQFDPNKDARDMSGRNADLNKLQKEGWAGSMPSAATESSAAWIGGYKNEPAWYNPQQNQAEPSKSNASIPVTVTSNFNGEIKVKIEKGMIFAAEVLDVVCEGISSGAVATKLEQKYPILNKSGTS